MIHILLVLHSDDSVLLPVMESLLVELVIPMSHQ